MEVYILNDFYVSHKNVKNIEYTKNDKGCFICISHAQNPSKYYKIKRNGKCYDLHAWIYEQYHGRRKKGLVVRHTCNNKECINPDHLTLGTYSQNAIDSIDDERNFITEEIANKVREMIEEGYKQYEISEILKLKTSHISKIHNRIIWNY